ncbi:hypothetical protein ZOSMA_15G01770 [Zostera marina]|uniref:Uncharacterized protein n=1 Tax=Zostera marina TaxID=29655 RepID=A0A0K9PX64_ZOSMR|nr:hypothetical protein ZOSMA_15G01770 [Zostera marina]
MKRHTSAMPLNVVSSAGSVHDSLKQTSIDTSEFESTATSRIKRAKIEAKFEVEIGRPLDNNLPPSHLIRFVYIYIYWVRI